MNAVEKIELDVEQPLVCLFSAAQTLSALHNTPEGRAVLCRPQCLQDVELVRNQLSRILDQSHAA